MSSPHLSNSGSSRSVGAGDDQDRLLDEANKNVKRNAFFMKKAIDEGNLKDVLKFSGEMVAELRTGALSPQNYYDLYISVTDELRHLDSYFEEVHTSSDLKSGLYETVQQISYIIPRLYLLITAGSVYIRTKTSPAMDILFDLVQLCKGVQHPTRGLFLRSYLTQCSKDNLPDVPSSTKPLDPSEQKPIKDAIEYVLQNFSEVNKLWVRMQHQGANRDRAKRERERQNLRMLAGTNLVRLSQLESIDLLAYKDIVLPRVLEQIINCKDKIAQEYLMDCLIQVFPDDYHLATLESFLSSCSQLQTNVNTKEVIISMMNRLSQFALQNPSAIPDDLEMFAMFRESSKAVIQTRPDMPIQDVLSLQVALVNFASKVYPERLSYVDDVLQFSSSVLQGSAVKIAPPKSVRHVVKLLTIPLETISVKVLDLSHYTSVLKYLDLPNRRQVANAIVQSVLESSVVLNDSLKLSTLFDYITPLLRDLDETSKEAVPDLDFQQEQHDLAKMLHLIHHQNTDTHYQLLLFVKKQISNRSSDHLSYTVPSLAFELLRLVPRVFEREQREDRDQTVTSRAVFKTIHQVISSIATTSPQLAVRLFLSTGHAADRCAFEEVCYEFMTQAFVTYEEEIANSKEQYAAIVLFAGTVQQLTSVGEENYKTLSTKVAQHAARLLKKGDQVRALCLCTHMFFTSKSAGPSKGEAVFSTLQRAIKVSNNVMDPKEQAELLIEILDHMVYFFEKEVVEVNADRVKTVVELVQEHLADLEDGKATKVVKNQFTQIMTRIKTRTSVADYPQSSESSIH